MLKELWLEDAEPRIFGGICGAFLIILQINLVDQHQHGLAIQGSSSSIITTRWETSSWSCGFVNLVGRPTNLQLTPTLPGIKLISKRTVTGSKWSRLKQKALRRQ
jgi:hypothetical protein